MNELALKYGCNPNQKPSRIYMEDGSDLPVTVLNGKPGYINFLDALNSIQLVHAPETRLCPVCGSVFLPDGRTRYCSPACAKKAHRRQQRDHMKKKRGWSVDN